MSFFTSFSNGDRRTISNHDVSLYDHFEIEDFENTSKQFYKKLLKRLKFSNKNKILTEKYNKSVASVRNTPRLSAFLAENFDFLVEQGIVSKQKKLPNLLTPKKTEKHLLIHAGSCFM